MSGTSKSKEGTASVHLVIDSVKCMGAALKACQGLAIWG